VAETRLKPPAIDVDTLTLNQFFQKCSVWKWI